MRSLRAKLVFTLLLANIITAGIVFFTLSTLQTRDESARIDRESLLFARFSTTQVASQFFSSFYFHYQDRFVPAVQALLATNPNAAALRIISARSGTILFDSDRPEAPRADAAGGAAREELPEELKAAALLKDAASAPVDRAGERGLRVVQAWRNENREPTFYLDYVFEPRTLRESRARIRRQILVDLIPALGLGLLIALVFARLLTGPIQGLVAALRRVTAGEYGVTVPPASRDEIGELVQAFNSMSVELKQKQELRKYLSDSSYRHVVATTGGAPADPGGLRGRRREAAVLMSDIRSFVALCDSLEAEEVTGLLTDYFTLMVQVVHRNGGEVDKFMGDALLAVFYSPDSAHSAPEATPALQAISCALEMRERLEEFNAQRVARQKTPVEIGVGITYGEIISGPIGSRDRMDFTVIGAVVNLASRIEKLSKIGRHTRVLFSGPVEEKVRGLVESVAIEDDRVRQIDEQLRVFELVRIRKLEELIAMLSAPEPLARRRAAELLGRSRNRDALPCLLQALSDLDEDTRLAAAAALPRLAPLDDRAALDGLFGRLRRESSPRAVSSLLGAIGKLCRTDRILELAPFLESPDERIVANTIEALGQARSPRCMDQVLPHLSSRNNRVKANAAMALFAGGRAEVVGTLKPMLMHSDPLMRSSAAFALGELAILVQREDLLERWEKSPGGIKLFLGELQESVSMLISLLRDTDLQVRRQAVAALGKIQDKTAVLPLIEHLDLKADSKELLREYAVALQAIGAHKLVREVLARASSGASSGASQGCQG
jgi:class 3 adenylate cyclase